jgi:hypothetical protein
MIDELLKQRAVMSKVTPMADAGEQMCSIVERCWEWDLQSHSAVCIRDVLKILSKNSGKYALHFEEEEGSPDEGCPGCGPPSALLVHLPFRPDGEKVWTLDL